MHHHSRIGYWIPALRGHDNCKEPLHVLGALLAFLSAATFAFNNASVRRGVLTGTVGQAMAITVPLGVPLFFLAALLTGNLAAVASFSPAALAALALAGGLHFVWGRYCNYRATRAMGANLVAPVQQVHLVVSLTLAIWLLGEELTALRILGIALVLIGPSFTMRERRRAGTSAVEHPVSDQKITAIDAERPAGFEPKYAEGYLFALLSAIGYGLSPILVRVGLESKGLGASLAGGLVAYIAATAVMGIGAAVARKLARGARRQPGIGEVVHALRRARVLLADVPLHGDVDCAGDGGLAGHAALAPVPAAFRAPDQSTARGLAGRSSSAPWSRLPVRLRCR